MHNVEAPNSTVESVILHNDKDLEGNWISMIVDIDSWVMLQASTQGCWEKEAKNLGRDRFRGSFKAQVRGFQFIQSSSSIAMRFSEICVRHAYHRWQLELNPIVQGSEPRKANYLYASYFNDWVHPISIIDHIVVVYVDIGEATRNGRIHKELLEQGTFFLRGMYMPATPGVLYGTMEPIELPAFTNPEWPLPNMYTSEAFRSMLAMECTAAMKATTGGSFVHVQCFMPMHIMVDLSANAANNIRWTTTLFVLKFPTDELLGNLIDQGWDTKYHIGEDMV